MYSKLRKWLLITIKNFKNSTNSGLEHKLVVVINMEKLEEFKAFIKKNPPLLNKVRNGTASWQQLYETYDIFGENHELFQTAQTTTNTRSEEKKTSTSTKGAGEYLTGAIKALQGIDVDKINSNLQNIQKVVGLFGELKGDSAVKSAGSVAKAFKRFDD